jgi:bifunctional ADP-heptose synthase (sugar kinase/adenylyltransferase)
MTKREKIIVTSGEFDFFDYYTLKFLQECKSRGDWLVVGIHTDMFMHLAHGGSRYTFEERIKVIEGISCVDEVFNFNDGDGTVCNLLKVVKYCYPASDITYVSDMDMKNMPEMKIKGIKFEFLKQE